MASKILNIRATKPDAKIVLVCFPWAGGGSNFYANWTKLLPDAIEVCGITLPGRESRFREPCCSQSQDLIEESCHAVLEHYPDRNLALWGHSLGALMAFQTALKLKTDHSIQPVRLFVSGVSGPHSAKRKEKKTGVDKMTDEEFKAFLRRLGGTPQEVLDNKELMELFLPPLRADYSMYDQFDYELPQDQAPPFTCPVDVFDGEADVEHDLESWTELTSAKNECSIRKLPGGHFYLKDKDNQDIILQHIAESLL